MKKFFLNVLLCLFAVLSNCHAQSDQISLDGNVYYCDDATELVFCVYDPDFAQEFYNTCKSNGVRLTLKMTFAVRDKMKMSLKFKAEAMEVIYQLIGSADDVDFIEDSYKIKYDKNTNRKYIQLVNSNSFSAYLKDGVITFQMKDAKQRLKSFKLYKQ